MYQIMCETLSARVYQIMCVKLGLHVCTKLCVRNVFCTCVPNYVYETRSPILREVHRLKVFDNRTLRRIFSPFERKYEETGENVIITSF